MTPEPRRIVLVGFMGAGKTTVGRRLAEHLGWHFVDLDGRIEARTGRCVAEIFTESGEAHFRDEERRAAEELADLEHCVVATGGGAWAETATRDTLAQGAVTVWLDCDLDTALARLPDDGSRPLASSREKMCTLLAARRPSYGLADVRIDAARPLDVVVQALVEELFPAGSGKKR